MFSIRLIVAIALLVPALLLLKLAQWICPEIKEQPQPLESSPCWLDAADGWENRVQ
jgi:hypothetical protein